MAVGEDAYATLVMNDAYLPGAAVLAHSLRDAGTHKKLACLIVPESLSASTIAALQSLYDYVLPVPRIGNPHPGPLYLMNRPDLLYTFTKINLWRQVQFRRLVYIDADVVALRAPDELFDVEEDFAAAPDVGWPDAFNTGVMSLKPQMGDYWALQTLAGGGVSFDGADQGLLNSYYEHKPWKRLSFTYNCTPSANYQYEPAYRHYKSHISLIHFIGRQKPWQRGRASHGTPGAYQELLSHWWAVYDRHFTVAVTDLARASYGQSESATDTVQQGIKIETVGAYTDHIGKDPSETFQTQITTKDQALQKSKDENVIIDQTGRKFLAPHMEWDGTRAAPPTESKPEAPDFPTTTYEFSNDPHPFRPPAQYPSPPKELSYDVPREASKEEKLTPVFPWEERDVPRPTRKFIDDEPVTVPAVPASEYAGVDEFEVQSDEKVGAITPTIQVNNEAPWTAFATSSVNAWDDNPAIGNYVRALSSHQKNRGRPQIVHSPTGLPTAGERLQMHILSPENEPAADKLIEQVQKRRESLILTDFPTASERPSLPVTPAPKPRGVFWGSDRDEDLEMPPAEGVPNQADWDPNAQLEQLRRNSLIAPSGLHTFQAHRIARRDMPATSADVPEAGSSRD